MIPEQELETPKEMEDRGKNSATMPRLLINLWAVLIARIYEVSPLVCPNGGAGMRIIAFIEDAEPVRSILTCVGEPVDPPRIHPLRAPPRLVGVRSDQHAG